MYDVPALHKENFWTFAHIVYLQKQVQKMSIVTSS